MNVDGYHETLFLSTQNQCGEYSLYQWSKYVIVYSEKKEKNKRMTVWKMPFQKHLKILLKFKLLLLKY